MENLEALYLLLLTGGVPTLFFGILELSEKIAEKRSMKRVSQNKPAWILEKIVREDIREIPDRTLKERLLEHYCEDAITPELLNYFDDNYLDTLLKLAKETNRSSEIQQLEKRQLARLEAVKKVKGYIIDNNTFHLL